MRITVHTIVKNEENFLWYSVMSVINNIDEMLLWDTGSTDNTINIIKILKKKYPKKIKVKFVKQKDIYDFTKISQQMVEETTGDWAIVVDGDEIWWEESICNLVNIINKNLELETIVSSYINCVGDIYHYQNEKMGRYKIDDKQGHLNIRAMNMNIPGLHYDKPHGQRGLYDSKNVLIQERPKDKRVHIAKPAYLHMTHLKRSSNDEDVAKRVMKYKYSKGLSFNSDFFYPEAFFYKRPKLIPNIWIKRSVKYELKASMFDSLRIVKNSLPIPEKSGY